MMNHTNLAAEAALCLWEAVLEDMRRPSDGHANSDAIELKEAIGSPSMRQECLNHGQAISEMWGNLTEEEREAMLPFDWEFVPLVYFLCTTSRYSLNLPLLALVKEWIASRVPLPRQHDPEKPLHKYDAAEVAPVREYKEGRKTFCEQCRPDQAQFWSVYLHLSSGGVECVADFATVGEADAYAETMTARIQDATATHEAFERRDRDEYKGIRNT